MKDLLFETKNEERGYRKITHGNPVGLVEVENTPSPVGDDSNK
jgi:hypothetical protein